MNTATRRSITLIGLTLCLPYGHSLFADTNPARQAEETVTGLAKSVNPTERTVTVKDFWTTKTFSLAEHCKISVPDKPLAELTDLRPGQKLKVRYREAQGVLVAEQIAKQDMVYTGHVREIDPEKHTLIIRGHLRDKSFDIAGGCGVMLHSDRSGTLADVQPGHLVTVVYESPDGSDTARQIEQKSESFAGSLTAVDLSNRTLQAKSFLKSKQFSLANDCDIVIRGKQDMKPSDLQLGENFVFNYNEVDGVDIVNRIRSEETASELPAKVSQHTASN